MGGWGWVLVLLTFGGWGGGGGVVQNRESPDFRSPEVGRYAYVTEAVFAESWLSVNTVEALCTRAFGGKDKLNRILKVSILFPYLLLNTAFSVRNNQC